MKYYPSIPPAVHHIGQPCIAFYKLDGSNLRFEWSKKAGWHKFGTRERLFDHTDPIFGTAIQIFKETYGDSLEQVFKKEKSLRNCQSVIVFAEFLGPRSFAGQHREEDKKEVILFDVNPHKQGILGPREFLDLFGHLKTPTVLYQGNMTPGFVTQVRESALPEFNDGNVHEGVICKGGTGHKLWMCKIKTDAYRNKLKETYADSWQQYWE